MLTREEQNTLRERFAYTREAVTEARFNGGTPEATARDLVDRFGAVDAAATVAAIVRTVGDWDERISRSARRWADSVYEAPTRDDLLAARIFCDLHPVHIDQLAHATMKLTVSADLAALARFYD